MFKRLKFYNNFTHPPKKNSNLIKLKSLKYFRYNVIGKAITYYFLPLSIIGVLYALMARRLHLSTREMPGELAGPQSRAQARARKHVARMVVTFVIGKKINKRLRKNK